MPLFRRSTSSPVARTAVGLCLAVLVISANAQDAAVQWLPHLDLEGKLGNKRNIGEADLFLPIAQDASTLYFANVRTRFDNEGSREGNFGLGMRRMLENGWNLGTYGYFDRRRSSDTGFYYNQATLGVEALGPDVDLRANAYVPLGTKTHGIGNISTAAISGSSVQVTTLNREERSLQGFDAEAGWRLPIFDSEARRQFRLYLGGYHFSATGISVAGPRARAELAFEDLDWFGRGTALFLGAETQHDDSRGSQQFVSLRLRIPLDKTGGERSPLSAQARRMTAPVMRDVDIVTQSHVASRLVETTTATANGQTFTLLSSDSAPSAAAISTALTNAGSGATILLTGTFNTTASVQLLANQTLTGILTVRSASGYTATINTGATINSVNASRILIVDSGGTVSGLTLSNTFSGGAGGQAILVNSTAANVTIANNIITVNQSGNNAAIGVTFDRNSGVVRDNSITITGNGSNTMTALAANTGTTTLTVANNTLNVSGGTNNYLVLSAAGTTFSADSTGNVRGSGSCNGTSASGSVVFTNNSHCP